MKSPNQFIVEPEKGKRYDNTKNIGGLDFIVSTSIEDHMSSNRFAKVISTPANYKGDITPGDTLVVHHNVFKYYNDMKGRRRSGKSFLKDNLFLIDKDQYFLYKRNGAWVAKDGFLFIKPIPKSANKWIYTSNTEEPLIGEVKYISSSESELSVGDVVSFLPNTEYAFTVDGEKLYRMYKDHITMKL